MNRQWRLAPLALAITLSGGCGTVRSVFEEPAPTLADLQPVELPAQSAPVPQVDLPELTQIYRDVLAEQQDPQTRLQVTHRLADIEMLQAEEQLATSELNDAHFEGAIQAYEALLENNADYAHRDRLLYQLSKAYALAGNSEQSTIALERLAAIAPDSPYLAEAYFRQAEREFVEADYAAAETLYASVIGYGEQTPFYTRALYMQGWSRFKQEKYDTAIVAFTASLDVLLPNDVAPQSLPRAEQELVNDSLRVLAIVFSRQQGTDTIASAYTTLGARPYEYLLYEALGRLYLSQERYADSARAYQSFVERYPASGRAHRFQLRVIEAYEAGGFEDLIVSAKQDYVTVFAVQGEYWLGSDEQVQQSISAKLRVFIPELAGHYHALAQSSRKNDTALSTQHYRTAAQYYELYLDSFPEDPQVAALTFLLAESRYEAGDYFEAIAAYEWVAYVHRSSENAADAGYTAIIAYEKLATTAGDDSRSLERERIDSELRFHGAFPADPRANQVLGHAATALLELEDYVAALAAGTALVDATPAAEPALLTTAWLVAGHALFALENYAAAEQAYSSSLQILPASDERRPATVERLAAAIYQQGEQASDSGEQLAAADHFQRAMAAAPGSDISVNAQFDAAQALLRAGDLSAANELLRDFRERYPTHALSAGISATLLNNYEQLAMWRAAAAELDSMRTENADEQFSRQALLQSADYYDRAGDSAMAIARYRSYAHTWPQPLNDNVEAMHRLTVLYGDAGEVDKQRFWLRKTLAAHETAGAAQTGRSRYLAANAASVLADDEFKAFTQLRIAQPINKTLPTKKRAMEKALAGYNRCSNFGVEQFVTRCTYRLGEVYAKFASDLMQSERPRGLDALAMEQYDIMLEEQAYPFEEKAIAIHESNTLRSRDGLYDKWVRQSFAALGSLAPARYAKHETATADERSLQGKVKELNLDAIALREMGDFGAALESYQQALDRSPDDALTHRNIGILYDLYLGKPGKALYHYGRYQALISTEDRAVAGWIVDLERRHVQLAREAL